MRLNKLKILSPFKNLNSLEVNFKSRQGITVFIGNNGSGKSNILEAISSVFAGLYDNAFNPPFSYLLLYEKDGGQISILFKDGAYQTKINKVEAPLRNEHLPNQVICSYSGEEDRLWKKYYEPFHKNFLSGLRGRAELASKMIYVNKDYWKIALTTLHFYNFEEFPEIKKFCKDFLGIEAVNFIRFHFNTARLEEWYRDPNPVTAFLQMLNPDKEPVLELTVAEIQARLSEVGYSTDFFKYLSAASVSPDLGVITDIEFSYNSGLTSESLSEGEKKILLIKLILEVVSDENSVVLMDEPDSHIHISRKQEFKNMLSEYENRENILTTHSPTLTHAFDQKHIAMLAKDEHNNVQVVSKEKQEIINRLTDGLWTLQEQNIFLNSRKDILLVEGKTDEIFLKKALSVLQVTKPEYRDLSFEYLPCGGATGVSLICHKFSPIEGQRIIALFDNDQTGWKNVNKIFGRENHYNSGNYTIVKRSGYVDVAIYPKRGHFRGTAFNIEDYFRKEILKKYVLKSFKSIDTVVTKDALKNEIARACEALPNKEFTHFNKVFDLILNIKSSTPLPEEVSAEVGGETVVV